MAVLLIVIIIVVAVFVILAFRSQYVGSSYKDFLQQTQADLLTEKFPGLTVGDLIDIQTTSTCDLIRHAFLQKYAEAYVKKQYDALKQEMDEVMIRSLVYVYIESWLAGNKTKADAINFLNDHKPYFMPQTAIDSEKEAKNLEARVHDLDIRLKNAFVKWVKEGMVDKTVNYRKTPESIEILLTQLWWDEEIMPDDICSILELPKGSTYDEGSREAERRLKSDVSL